MPERSLLGVGVYSIPEAARISRVPAQYITRWLWGYKYVVHGKPHQAKPLWTPQISPIDDRRALTFRDLIEIQFVHRFRKEGISLQTIRKTIDLATDLLDKSYPLSSVKFKTEGKGIFAQVIEDPNEKGYVFNLKTGQYLLDYALDFLYDALEYSKFDELLRWWPLGKDRRIVIDPKRSFGRPIVEEGVQTNIISRALRADGSAKTVADWFEISEASVNDALEFERSRAVA